MDNRVSKYEAIYHEMQAAKDRAEKAEAALKLATERNVALREAVKPFVEIADGLLLGAPDHHVIFDFATGIGLFAVGDLRKLAAAARDKPTSEV
jgi:hypothetical protein